VQIVKYLTTKILNKTMIESELLKRSAERAMFAKRLGHLNRTFEQDIEKDVRTALSKRYHNVRKTKDGKIRIGFDNMKHVDISINKKSPE